MVSMSSMGQTGPFAHYHGLGFHLQGFAGFNQVTGFPDREPFGSIAYTDFTGPPFAVCSIMGALDFRRRTGQGMFIDLSQVEAALHLLGPVLLDMSVNGREAQRYGNYNPIAAPHAAYRCKGKDRWCVIAVFTDEQWRALVKVMGAPAWAREARFQTLRDRLANLKELDAQMERWTLERSPEEVRDTLQEAGVPASVVETGRDLAEDKHLAARQFFQTFPHPEIESALTRRSPVRYSDADSSVPKGASTLGQDNEFVCTKILGMSDEEWVKLLEEGVLVSV
jgi:benzylsuccinate CoA-transferase BbsF subunit